MGEDDSSKINLSDPGPTGTAHSKTNQKVDSPCERLMVVITALIMACFFLLIVTIRLGGHIMYRANDAEWTVCAEIQRNITWLEERLRCLETTISAAEQNKCPSGWTFISDKCYFFSDDKKPRDESDDFCAKHGAKLATVKGNDPELQFQIKRSDSVFWVGLMQRKEVQNQCSITMWTWSDGTIQKSLYNEIPAQCAAMNLTIEFKPCESALRWICEKTTEKHNLYEQTKNC
ncbi:Hypothetical predicted protein [Pelobates cultripes]|uniref:C-type lectin domain-containing protein n=1 Tax=Pelobates cultripes TaxID=61616 RepID=A0AAD1SCN1_PELCU|nr:Hypothetical predicted protein [Pelobates cultripes]